MICVICVPGIRETKKENEHSYFNMAFGRLRLLRMVDSIAMRIFTILCLCYLLLLNPICFALRIEILCLQRINKYLKIVAGNTYTSFRSSILLLFSVSAHPSGSLRLTSLSHQSLQKSGRHNGRNPRRMPSMAVRGGMCPALAIRFDPETPFSFLY